MPEIRLAWRASLCWSSGDRQVLVGTAPVGELRALTECMRAERVRRYRLPPIDIGAPDPVPGAGYGADAEVFGIVCLWPNDDESPIDGREVMLTLKLDSQRSRSSYARSLPRARTGLHRPFVAAIGMSKSEESALFARLAAMRPVAIPDLCRRLSAEPVLVGG
jgi:hypothetical protein